jgi:hypothetical protein
VGKKRKQEEEQHEEGFTCITTKTSPPFVFLSFSLSLSLSFDVAINGAHQQSVITIGTPPMPLVVTFTSSKF